MRKTIFMLLLALSLGASAQNKISIYEIKAIESAPKNASGWGYGAYDVFVRVDYFDYTKKEHWDAIRRYSENYCGRYRDRYFSLYFMDGIFNHHAFGNEVSLKDPTQYDIFDKKCIAYIQNRLPNESNGSRREAKMVLGNNYTMACSDKQFSTISGLCYPFYYPCGE